MAMDDDKRKLHLIRTHDFSPRAVAQHDDEYLRNWHSLDHKADHTHEHEGEGY